MFTKRLLVNSILIGLLIMGLVSTSFLAKNKKDAFVPMEKVEVPTAIKPVNEKNLEIKKVTSKSVFEVADSICHEAGVPFDLVKEIGQNESGWRYIGNKTGGSDFGDLQVIDITFDFWYKRLKLKGGKTRRNYLKIGIYYLRWLHNREGSWRKARFAYGRGNWRPENTWTEMEKRFMNKIDWSKYDK